MVPHSAEEPTAAAVAPVSVGDPQVRVLLDALTAELAGAGYTAEETFGYSHEQLGDAGVQLLGATVEGRLVGVGGVEQQGEGMGELKRCYVLPEHRGTGAADALLRALIGLAGAQGVAILRLETGEHQHAAGGPSQG